MFISVPGDITFHFFSSTQTMLWGTKIESSLLVLQKRVICPKIHSSKEQNFSYLRNFFLPSPCSLITTAKYVSIF